MTPNGKSATRIAVLDDYQAVAERMADWHSGEHPLDPVFFSDHLTDEDALAERLLDFDIVVVMRERTPLRAEVIKRLPRLRLIVTTGMRNAAVDANAGVPVCGTESLGTPTVELTWALILALQRNLRSEEESLRNGHWQSGSIGAGLAGSTLGVLGLGRIGTKVAAVGLAFGMNVIAWSQHLTPQLAGEKGVEWVSEEDLFQRSDVLSIHLQLSSRTAGLVTERHLHSMKSTAVLVNTSRAGIVDQDALVATLGSRSIGGAGLDVFDTEPIAATDPLLSTPSTLLTPHLGYVTRQNYELFFRGAVESINAFLDGHPIRVISPG